MTTAVSSLCRKNPHAPCEEQKPYWVEFQLVDEQGEPVANIPWTAESSHPVSGTVDNFTYTGQSDSDGLVRIDMPHGLELTLKLESNALINEMEKRALRPGRDAETDSLVRQPAVDAGHIWHYAVVGELSSGYPNIELHKGEPYHPSIFHLTSLSKDLPSGQMNLKNGILLKFALLEHGSWYCITRMSIQWQTLSTSEQVPL